MALKYNILKKGQEYPLEYINKILIKSKYHLIIFSSFLEFLELQVMFVVNGRFKVFLMYFWISKSKLSTFKLLRRCDPPLFETNVEIDAVIKRTGRRIKSVSFVSTATLLSVVKCHDATLSADEEDRCSVLKVLSGIYEGLSSE